MRVASLDVPDLNVWLALVDSDHVHHNRARQYWEREALAEIAFCRLTMLGLLRLLTHPKVMRGMPFTIAEAWSAYNSFAALPEIRHVDESAAADEQFVRWTMAPTFRRYDWTDAWIAALAHSAGGRVVSFDSDFSTFKGLRLLQLHA
jgi:toxin-antitoxin system PIN domain toxin